MNWCKNCGYNNTDCKCVSCPVYHIRLNRFHKPEPQGRAMACEHGPCETCPLDGKYCE